MGGCESENLGEREAKSQGSDKETRDTVQN